MAQARIDRALFLTDSGVIDIRIAGVTRAQVNDLAEKVEALLTQWNADHDEPRFVDGDTKTASEGT